LSDGHIRPWRMTSSSGNGWQRVPRHANPLELAVVPEVGFAILKATGRSAAWLACLPWEQEVGGSNPPAPIYLDKKCSGQSVNSEDEAEFFG
jgi:hypothetical protein